MVAARNASATGWSSATVPALLDALSARRADPAGGAGAAMGVATAAALVAMCARFADRQRSDHAALADEAEHVQAKALELLEDDAVAFAPVLQVRRWGDSGALEAALENACRTPMAILEAATRLAELGDALARTGNPRLAGDARAATCLAVGAGHAAAALIRENLGADADEPLMECAQAMEATLDAYRQG
ncbi:cyclodeaminase/cyclohydrolase family protein [Arhodomonas sp. AD133]|uniref:cyclodeaminase/cyclohydrolase family protein n=1 Tax=Arhodomonas sp. AD133 TaxID=3415009 RepID=UPI003EB83768